MVPPYGISCHQSGVITNSTVQFALKSVTCHQIKQRILRQDDDVLSFAFKKGLTYNRCKESYFEMCLNNLKILNDVTFHSHLKETIHILVLPIDTSTSSTHKSFNIAF